MYKRRTPPLNAREAQVNRYDFQAAQWSSVALGSTLRAYREAYGKSIEQVATDLCLRRAQVRGLESGSYSDLPDPTFSAGFVRSYAKYLGLPEHELVAKFHEEYRASRGHPRPASATLKTGSLVAYSPRWPSFAVLAIAVLLLGSSYMVMSAYTAVQNPHVDTQGGQGVEVLTSRAPTVPSAPEFDEPDIEIVFEGVTPDPIPTPDVIDLRANAGSVAALGVVVPLQRPTNILSEPLPIEPAQVSHRVIVRATGLARVRIKDPETGIELISASYQRGDEYAVPNGKIVSLLITDSRTLEILIDGESYQIPFSIAELGEPLILDPDTIVETGGLIPTNSALR